MTEFVAGGRRRIDRVLLRALLGPLSALTLVIVASALLRMADYEQAYGFTRRRLLVISRHRCADHRVRPADDESRKVHHGDA